MTNNEDRDVRLQCLDLAVRSLAGDPLTTAEKFLRFVNGGDPTETSGTAPEAMNAAAQNLNSMTAAGMKWLNGAGGEEA